MAWLTGEDRWLQAGVLAIVVAIHGITVLGVLPPWLGFTGVGLAVQVSGNALAAMIYLSYYMASVTEPGAVPHGWTPDAAGSSALTEVKKVSRKPRYCQKCQAFKPPRTHHCSVCNRCVLRMDHHCAWINNCVGYYNYAHFYRFLLYVTLTVLYAVVVVMVRVTHIEFKTVGRTHQREMTNIQPYELVVIVIDLMFMIPVLFAVGILLGFHTYYILTNTTTIEAFQKERVEREVQRQRVKALPFPYDLGPARNWRAILGPSLFTCLWPVPMAGDGLAYPVLLKAGQIEDGEDVSWPPPLFDEVVSTGESANRDAQANAMVDTGAGVGDANDRHPHKDRSKII